MSMISYDDSYYPTTTFGAIAYLVIVLSPFIAVLAFLLWLFC